MNYELITISLLLIVVANATPVIAADILKTRWDYPIDGGHHFIDGRAWLGASKTWRGISVSFITTSLMSMFLGFSWQLGLVVACAAMSGDLIASFSKRRLGIVASDRALFLDQVPESLLPAYALHYSLGITFMEAIVVIVIFMLVVLVISPILYRLHIRKRPY